MKSKEDLNFNIGFDPDRVGYNDSGDTSWIDAYEERPREPKKKKKRDPNRRPAEEPRQTAAYQEVPQESIAPSEPIDSEEDYPVARRREPRQKKTSVKRHREPRESREPREMPGFVKFFLDSRTHAVIGIAMILLAAYLLVSAMSYFSTSKADQSAVVNMGVEQMVTSGQAIDNVGGPVGAKVSYFMITKGWGLGALTLIFYMIVIGLSLIGLKKKIHFWSFTLKCLLTTISISLIVGLIEIAMHSSRAFPIGGFHGRYANLWLIERVGMIGAIAISCLLAATLICVFIREISVILFKLKAKWDARRAERLAAKQAALPDVENGTEQAGPPTAEELELPMLEGDNRPIEIPLVHATYSEDENAQQPKEATQPGQSFESPLQPGHSSITAGNPMEAIPSIPTIATTPSSPTTPERQNEEEHELLQVNALFKSESEPTLQHHVADDMASKNEITLVEEPNFKVSSNVIEEGVETDSTLYDPTAELSRYHRPGLDLLVERQNKSVSVDLEEQEENKARIIKTLHDYGIGIAHIEAKVGPTVTLYEIIPSEGTRIAKIKRLEDDIALSLAALGIRIIAPIPGKGTVGIEVPNKDPQTVSIRSVLGSKAFMDCKYELPMAMGATISNEVYIADLAKMPHLLVAGATGQGKSVGLNTIIASLLYKKHPAELKFVLVDPKMVEFSLYGSLQSHFMAQLPDEEDAVVTDMAKVERTLNSLCVEMDNRYDLLKDANVRTLKEYNEKFINRRLNPEKGHRYLPYIVIIVDEFADLIMTSGKAIETPIARIAQKARAVGMHMIIATQRPSTNVITGIIKANFPGRIAFRVSQMVDSKTILDRPGANQLIGRGDMLFSHNGSMERVQCAFIDTPEVEAMVNFIADQPGYEHPYYLPEPQVAEAEISVGNMTNRDPLFEDAARYFCSTGDTASTSMLQRKFSVGYNRAGKIMDQLEAAGIVGPAQGSKPRALLVDLMQLDQMFGS